MNYILFALFVILQFLDFWTTYNVIKLGKGHEGNPVMAWLFSKIGVIGGFAFIKTIMLIIVGYIVYTMPVNASIFALTIFNVLYGYVVFMNYKILRGN